MAFIELIPPLPSLFAVLLVALSLGLWKVDKKGLAIIPGAVAGFMLAGWALSMVSWLLGILVFAALAAGGLYVGKKVVDKKTADRKKRKAGKKSAKAAKKAEKSRGASATAVSPAELPAGSNLDISALLQEVEKETANVKRS